MLHPRITCQKLDEPSKVVVYMLETKEALVSGILSRWIASPVRQPWLDLMSLQGSVTILLALHWCQPKLIPAHFLQFALNSGQLLGFTQELNPSVTDFRQRTEAVEHVWRPEDSPASRPTLWSFVRWGFFFFSWEKMVIADCYYKSRLLPSVVIYILTRKGRCYSPHDLTLCQDFAMLAT